jgi:hypothetical protein
MCPAPVYVPTALFSSRRHIDDDEKVREIVFQVRYL